MSRGNRRNRYHGQNKNRPNQQNPPRAHENQVENKDSHDTSKNNEAVFPRIRDDQKVEKPDQTTPATWGFLSRKPSGYNPQKNFNPNSKSNKKYKIVSSIGGMTPGMNEKSIVDEIDDYMNMDIPALTDIGEISLGELKLNSIDFENYLNERDQEQDDILEGYVDDD